MNRRRTVLITGATAGLGRAVAEALAADGHQLLVHGRTPGSAGRAAADLRAVGGVVEPVHGDLAVLGSVPGLAEQVRQRVGELHVLVNNAGIGAGPPPHTRREEGADGHELRFTVNYLAPVLLTRLLAPLLARSAPARVVNIGSVGQAPVDIGDVDFRRRYHGAQAYFRSKFALAAFTRDLAALLPAGVTATCVHPASLMNTRQVREVGAQPWCDVEVGVPPVLDLVLGPAGERTGAYYDGRKLAAPHPGVDDPDLRERLRARTDELLAPFTPGVG